MAVTSAANTIKQTVKFRARPQDFYEVFMSEKIMGAMTGSKTLITAKVGGGFSYFNGQITGVIQELSPNEKMTFRWRMKEWEDGVFSTVHITLHADEYGVTTLDLVQTGIPQADKYGHHSLAKKVEEGWEMHFWDPIKKFCGFDYRA